MCECIPLNTHTQSKQLGVVAHNCRFSSWEVGKREQRFKDSFSYLLHSEFELSPGYMPLCLKKQMKKINN